MSNEFDYTHQKGGHNFYDVDKSISLTSEDKKVQGLFDKILSVFDTNKNHTLDKNEVATIWDNIYSDSNGSIDENNDGILSIEEVQKNIIDKDTIFARLKITAEELINFLNILDKKIKDVFAETYDNTNNRLHDELKAKYPPSEYKIEEGKHKLSIINKKDNKMVMQCTIYANGSYDFTYITDGESNRIESYDSDGNLTRYSTLEKRKNYNEWVPGDPISDSIYEDITAKTKIGLPTTSKDIEKHIKQITPDNVLQVLNDYKERYGESLYDALKNEWGLDKEVKARIEQHLNQCISQNYLWQKYKPNTKIDEDFEQGNIGDCYFLASIAAIKRSPNGQKILDDTIKDNGDGTYTVKFKGAKKEYIVSAFEIQSKDEYTTGDTDIRILEIAANKHYLTGVGGGGNPASALELLLGTGDKWKNFGRTYSPKPAKEEIAKLLENPNMVITTFINPYSKLFGLVMNPVDDSKEYKEDIATAHAYAIVGIDDNNVYLINPWYTDKTISVPLDVFDDYWASVQYTEIK